MDNKEIMDRLDMIEFRQELLFGAMSRFSTK